MNKLRAVFTGAFVWLLVFMAFAVLGFIPSIKGFLNQQALIIGGLMIPFATLGAFVYYKNGNKENGVMVGLIMTGTALVLDALATVPFIEIPKGGSYQGFYTYPLLWLLVVINIGTVYFYWRLKINNIGT